ncbi:alpha/beta fold hydrolase [Gordonia sp. TBRC 11910]|uniref:Alpha/beta fold hydrolase n=1 Tax=Gordonia asplenii TaxID=2725283 RepID=A0A848L344_9ACTN|nr:alpha/beta fold hydrolase [Gordonia asplenii]NMO03023.1 alpha/beta fold hydrolase [Gordonia asplenii]
MTSYLRPDWVDADLYPFDSRFIEIDGNVVHYIDEGTGPTLLMLHGNPTWSFVYRDVIARLSDRFRCIALDYPGFGLSTASRRYRLQPDDHAATVAAFVDRLDLADVTLVAHDWGGPIGLCAAQFRSERFLGLVLLNTWAWPLNGDIRAELASRAAGGLVGRELTRRFNLFVNALIPAGHRRRKPTASEMDHYRNALPTRERRNGCATLPGAIIGSRDFLADVEDHLDRFDGLPTLLIWADGDVALGDKERRRWEATLSDLTTVTIRDAGHFVQSDAPDDVAEAITRWWETVGDI